MEFIDEDIIVTSGWVLYDIMKKIIDNWKGLNVCKMVGVSEKEA